MAQCRTPPLDAVLTRSAGTLVPTEVSPAHPQASAASLGVDAHGLEQSGEVKVRARHLRALQLEARRLHGGWVGGWVRGVGVCGSRAQPQVPRACNTYAHAHAGHMRSRCSAACSAACSTACSARCSAACSAGCVHLESVHDVLLRVEVGARGLRRAGEQLAELLEAAVVPAAGAQAALEGRSRLAPCWRGGRLPRLPRATATAWAAACAPPPAHMTGCGARCPARRR